MEQPEHFADCDGNGSISCWHCGGEGFYEYEDDPGEEHECSECGGSGEMRCPGCAWQDGAG